MEISEPEYELLSRMANGLADERQMDSAALRQLVSKKLALELPDHQASVITRDGVQLFLRLKWERAGKPTPGGD